MDGHDRAPDLLKKEARVPIQNYKKIKKKKEHHPPSFFLSYK
jgi:hypothetical protein